MRKENDQLDTTSPQEPFLFRDELIDQRSFKRTFDRRRLIGGGVMAFGLILGVGGVYKSLSPDIPSSFDVSDGVLGNEKPSYYYNLDVDIKVDLQLVNIYNDKKEIIDPESIQKINHRIIRPHKPFNIKKPLVSQSPLDQEANAVWVIVERKGFSEKEAGYIPTDDLRTTNGEVLSEGMYSPISFDNDGHILIGNEKLPEYIEEELGKISQD